MKKTYKNPEIKVVNVQTTQMVATSIEVYGKNATAPGMSRRRNTLWDDEDEE